MTPQGRTDLNNTLRHYEQMVKMKVKTQDDYEGHISMLNRQINDLTGKLLLAEKTIQDGADDETPMPLLHMMERCSEAEKKYEDLRRDIIGAVIDCPDYTAVAGVAHKVWQTTCPPQKEQKTEEDVALALLDDVINTEELITDDTLQEMLDEKDDDCDAKLEDAADEAKDYLIGEVDDRIEGAFHEHMNQTAPYNFTGDWEDNLVAIGERMGHYILVAETETNNAQIAEEALRIVKDENEVNKKNLSKFITEKHTLKCQLEQAEVKCRGLEKVIEDTTGWGTFIEDLDEQQINNLRQAGYEECDITTEEEEDLAYDLNEADEEAEERPENPALSFFPDLKKVPKMEKFMNQGGHIKLEKADMTGNTAWMKACAEKGYLEAMKCHRKMTGSCFEWNCFDEWVKTQ